ncbi:MAG: asparaginase domain-containing protein [Spirochaetaceae bacterium]|nr:asparaginase domain-containing protein [Spirochaetaceae bacterium]
MYKSHIALEVRILLLTGDRIFSFGAPKDGEDSPQARSLGRPSLDSQAVLKACTVIRSLGGLVKNECPFERNLNPPQTPSELGLSHLSLALGSGGSLDIMFHRREKKVGIAEIRIEEDAGRLIHAGNGTRMDYATAGLPSLRIRTGPDFEIGEEAEVFLSDLRRRIQYLEIVPPPLESVMRCNAYVAITPYPEIPREFVKLRNLNSFNFVHKAVNAELSRQEEILIGGGEVPGESRIWNETRNITQSYQKRKSAERPRFETMEGMAPFVPGPEVLTVLENFSVELPALRRERFMRDYRLSLSQASFVCDEKSRADYFEELMRSGAPAQEAAQWLSSYIVKELKRRRQGIAASPLTPARFSRLLDMLDRKRIHRGIAKQAITAVLEEDKDPEVLVRERGWEQLTDRGTVEDLVRAAIAENPQEVRRIREGDAGPIQFLTGRIMKESSGLAEPSLVKDVLREQLSVSLVYVLSMGGAISGTVNEEGAVESGDEKSLQDLLSRHAETGRFKVRFDSIQIGRILSEEIIPSDWAALIEAITERLNSGTANGIVIAHGADTLPYTAPLLYWLFADAGAPIVLAASSQPPGVSDEAEKTMKLAVDLAVEKSQGVYVVYGGKVLSPLNLKFERIGADGFRNWNMEKPVFSGSSLLAEVLEADQYVLSQLLEDAANSMCVIRLYPGMRSDYLVSLMDKGVRNFFLELYDTGTAGFREGPYSLKRAFQAAKRRQTRFYCTSQQEGLVDFSHYSTSMELWRCGAVPMGSYTTETAVSRFLAASIIADSEEERAQLMEAACSELAD